SPYTFFFFPICAAHQFYTLSLHDALPISVLDLTVEVLGDQVLSCQRALVERAYGSRPRAAVVLEPLATDGRRDAVGEGIVGDGRSEEHTSELQSRFDLVCRLLLEKKKRKL